VRAGKVLDVGVREQSQAGPAKPGDGGPAAARGPADTHERLLDSVPAPVLRSFRERLLGPLAEYDARHHAELLPTLRSFLACDGSWSACAARMYVHVNTVRYRIGRIEALTGRDLSALPDRVDFFLALRAA
jgi:DNA-binding PucR family transcriptional regulator